MQQAGLLSAWRRWLALVGQGRLARRVVQRLQRRRAAHVWGEWQFMVHIAKRRRERLEQISRRLQRIRFLVMWRAWRELVHVATRIAERGKRAEQVVRRAVLAMQQAGVAAAWRAWREFVRGRRVGRRVVLRLRRLHMTAAWDVWVSTVEQALDDAEGRLQRAVLTMRRSLLKTTFRTWRAMAPFRRAGQARERMPSKCRLAAAAALALTLAPPCATKLLSHLYHPTPPPRRPGPGAPPSKRHANNVARGRGQLRHARTRVGRAYAAAAGGGRG